MKLFNFGLIPAVLLIISAPLYAGNAYSALSAGVNHSCVLLDDASVKCWGNNDRGQLGSGDNEEALIPASVGELSDVAAIATGHRYHNCALTGSGTVECWGYNANGQLGDGGNDNANSPVAVGGLSGVTALALGDWHSCARTSTGKVKCWGSNSYGQLGDGTIEASNTPVTVSGLTGIAAIVSGGWHTCALTTTGTVKCWGYNDSGQLGNGSNVVYSKTPVTVSGLSSVVAIAAGERHSCALTASGTVKCWGTNSVGELGNGSFSGAKNVPVAVKSLTGVAEIDLGASHSCARTTAGVVKCWGYNAYGQLGNNSTTNSNSPVAVSGLTNVTALTSGSSHNCALIAENDISCWGNNSYGQLGDATLKNAKTPVAVVFSTLTKIFYSSASLDGWILESSETSNKGGAMNSSSTSLRIGDSAADRQARSFLHFNTSSLPNTAVIAKATLSVRRSSLVGSTTNLGAILADIRNTYFGNSNALVVSDFESSANVNGAAILDKVTGSYLYKGAVASANLSSLSKTSTTQFRLRFQYDDNDDLGEDYLNFYSGNYTTTSYRPTLTVQYYVP